MSSSFEEDVMVKHLQIYFFDIKVEDEVINREWGGKWRCWAGNYDGAAIQRANSVLHYFAILHEKRQSSLDQTHRFLWKPGSWQFVFQATPSRLSVTFAKPKVRTGQTEQQSDQKITNTQQIYVFWKRLSRAPSENWGWEMSFTDTSFRSLNLFWLRYIFKFSAVCYF